MRKPASAWARPSSAASQQQQHAGGLLSESLMRALAPVDRPGGNYPAIWKKRRFVERWLTDADAVAAAESSQAGKEEEDEGCEEEDGATNESAPK